MTQSQAPIALFSDMSISTRLVAALEQTNIINPTPIQHRCIPVGLEGKDVLGIAQTGTGKTLAFGIPILQRLDRLPGRALVIVPTRELAQQVNDALNPLGRIFNIGTAVLIGGVPIGGQKRALATKPRLIIATPGRLIDFMEQRAINLDDISILVLDEADRMFDMGFAPQLNRILKAIPKKRQTMLFSATMPPAILTLATAHMALPVHVEVAPSGTAAERIQQEVFMVLKESKLSLLQKLIEDHEDTILVFSRTKHNAKKLNRALKLLGHKTAEIHANRSQAQRREALAGFKSGKYRVLIATDIAARGIDVKDIGIVVNYDLPGNAEDYVHRIGRTGRAGKAGRAVSFATPDQRQEIRAIEKLMRKSIPVSETPDLPKRQGLPAAKAHQPQQQPLRSRNRPPGRGRNGAGGSQAHASPHSRRQEPRAHSRPPQTNRREEGYHRDRRGSGTSRYTYRHPEPKPWDLLED